MELFDQQKKLIIVYLSKTGCLDYTKEMIKGFKKLDPLIVCSQHHLATFSSYEQRLFKTGNGHITYALRSVRIKTQIFKFLAKLEKEYGALDLYFPAFHLWNHHFVDWAARNTIHSSSLTIHDFYTHTGEQSRLIEKLQRKAILQATKVLCLTEYVSQQIRSELGSEISCTLVPHPLLPTAARNTLAHAARLKLLALGRMVDYKGIDLLCAAVSGLNIESLTIAGQQKRKISTIDPRINIIDKVLTDEEIAELLESHHLLVLPYKDASQSGVLMLGIAAHMVMVITKVGGLPEQLPEHAGLWVQPDITSLQQGIQKLIDNPELYTTIKAELSLYANQLV